MVKESSISRTIKNWLNEQPDCIAFKYHGGAYSEVGVPDLFGSCCGRAFFFETKVPKGKGPTVIQRHQIRKIRRKGGISCVVRSLEEVQKIVGEVRNAKT